MKSTKVLQNIKFPRAIIKTNKAVAWAEMKKFLMVDKKGMGEQSTLNN